MMGSICLSFPPIHTATQSHFIVHSSIHISIHPSIYLSNTCSYSFAKKVVEIRLVFCDAEHHPVMFPQTSLVGLSFLPSCLPFGFVQILASVSTPDGMWLLFVLCYASCWGSSSCICIYRWRVHGNLGNASQPARQRYPCLLCQFDLSYWDYYECLLLQKDFLILYLSITVGCLSNFATFWRSFANSQLLCEI